MGRKRQRTSLSLLAIPIVPQPPPSTAQPSRQCTSLPLLATSTVPQTLASQLNRQNLQQLDAVQKQHQQQRQQQASQILHDQSEHALASYHPQLPLISLTRSEQLDLIARYTAPSAAPCIAPLHHTPDFTPAPLPLCIAKLQQPQQPQQPSGVASVPLPMPHTLPMPFPALQQQPQWQPVPMPLPASEQQPGQPGQVAAAWDTVAILCTTAKDVLAVLHATGPDMGPAPCLD